MTEKPTPGIMLFGTDQPPAETRILTAGPLTVELDAGNLRYIRFAGREAIRAISYVVRDQYWGTFNPEFTDFAVEESAEGFKVSYTATCRDGDRSFGYRATIQGTPNGDLRFEAVGAASGDFLTSRTGFVVLHALDGVSGHPVTVEDVDGLITQTVFPERIDPKQPIMNIRALTHAFAPGCSVVCTMNGDTFEMEDQRNWTDASYKTYVRPLALPHPFIIADGEEISQSVTLSFEGQAPAASVTAAAENISVAVGSQDGLIPDFGMAIEAQHVTAALDNADRLETLKPKFLSCYLDARQPGGATAMQGFRALGERLGVELALEVVVPGVASAAEELNAVAQRAGDAGASFATVAVTPAGDLGFVVPGAEFPDTQAFDDLFDAARAAFPDARIGGGNFVYFTELNRKRPPFAALDFVTHGTSALVHAADDRSVTETIECLPYVIGSARALFGGKHYRIAPAGIGSRTSPFGNEPPANPHAERITMTRADPRQRGLLGAAWHLGYAARVSEGGVDSVVLAAPVGEFGLMHAPMDYAQPWYDEAGGLYPAFHVMRAIYGASGAQRLATTVSAPRSLQALAMRNNAASELWLANLTGAAMTVTVSGMSLNGARIARLDEDSFEACASSASGFDATETGLTSETLSLEPYATARIRT